MDWRLYTFCNLYLSSIQQGIQTAHVVHSLFTKYAEHKPGFHLSNKYLWNWAERDKTIIVLNGGTFRDITDIYEELWCFQSSPPDTISSRLPNVRDLPFEAFHEDNDSLGGLMTCVGVVVPECYYDVERLYDKEDEKETLSFRWQDLTRRGSDFVRGSIEFELIDLLKSRDLAR